MASGGCGVSHATLVGDHLWYDVGPVPKSKLSVLFWSITRRCRKRTPHFVSKSRGRPTTRREWNPSSVTCSPKRKKLPPSRGSWPYLKKRSMDSPGRSRTRPPNTRRPKSDCDSEYDFSYSNLDSTWSRALPRSVLRCHPSSLPPATELPPTLPTLEAEPSAASGPLPCDDAATDEYTSSSSSGSSESDGEPQGPTAPAASDI